MENWLRDLLPSALLSLHFVVERAHRVLAQRPRPGSRPHPFLFKLLNYHDWDVVLHETRTLDNLTVGSSCVMFFPDYTAMVQRRRSTYLAVKKQLRELGLPYSLLFPSRLPVINKEGARFFDVLSDVWDWLEETEQWKGKRPVDAEEEAELQVQRSRRRRRRGAHRGQGPSGAQSGENAARAAGSA